MAAQISRPASNHIPHDAIIYIPGLNFVANQSLHNIVKQIADAMEHASKMKSATFAVEGTEYQVEYGARTFNYRTILRNENRKPTRAMDVYELNYLPSFTQDYRKVHPVLLLLRMLFVVLANLGHLVTFVFSKAKNIKEKIQIFFALAVVGVLVSYLVILSFAIADLVRPQLAGATQTEATATAQPITAAQAPVQTGSEGSAAANNSQPPTFIFQWIVVLVALAQLVVPKLAENLRHGIERSAIDFMSVIDYFSLSTRREPIEGHFLDLLECIAEKAAYHHVYVITCSFGGIVALDAIFPGTHDPVQRVNIIDGLVTIGNPFDFCRSVWPKFFQQRRELAGKALCWINVYSPIDILGSNFRNSDEVGECDLRLMKGIGLKRNAPKNIPYPRNISYRDFGLLELLTFIGLRAHATYLQAVTEGETSCFTPVMPQLLKETKWLI